MNLDRVFHFSEEAGLGVFIPRPVVRHPEHEPMVWAIDEWHSPLYFFPRDCPRIGVWPVPSTSDEDRGKLFESGVRMKLFVDRSWESAWRDGNIFRYEFDRADFTDRHDHGVWVTRKSVRPISMDRLKDLPLLAVQAGVCVEIVDSLASVADQWIDRKTSLHVSMIRISLLG